jgi:hypothetical protein
MRIKSYFALLILILFSFGSTVLGQAGIKDTLWVKVTFYDFHADGSNPEFNPDYGGGVYKNMVMDALDSERKPVIGTNVFFNKCINKWFLHWIPRDYTIPVYEGRSGEYDHTDKVTYDTAFKNIVMNDSPDDVFTFDFFYAERHVSKSCIKITTNMINRTDGTGPKVTSAILKPNTDIHGKDTMIINFSTPVICSKLISVLPESSFVYASDGTNLIKGSSYIGICNNQYINSVKILVNVSSNTNQQNDSIGFRKGAVYVIDPEVNHPNYFVNVKVEIDRKSSIQVTGYPSPASPDIPFSSQILKSYSQIIGNNISGSLVELFTRVPLQLVPGTDRYGSSDIYDATANIVCQNIPLKFSGTSGVYGIYWNIKNRNDRIVGNGTYLVVIKTKYYDVKKLKKGLKLQCQDDF